MDVIHGHLIDETTIFHCSDNSINYVFSEHFFEHVEDVVVERLLSESYRCLMKNSVIRIIVPDYELMFEKYKNNDHQFFLTKSALRAGQSGPNMVCLQH